MGQQLCSLSDWVRMRISVASVQYAYMAGNQNDIAFTCELCIKLCSLMTIMAPLVKKNTR